MKSQWTTGVYKESAEWPRSNFPTCPRLISLSSPGNGVPAIPRCPVHPGASFNRCRSSALRGIIVAHYCAAPLLQLCERRIYARLYAHRCSQSTYLPVVREKSSRSLMGFISRLARHFSRSALEGHYAVARSPNRSPFYTQDCISNTNSGLVRVIINLLTRRYGETRNLLSLELNYHEFYLA